jgi:hypothetical protein
MRDRDIEIVPVNLKPERRAELADYAERHGQDIDAALDDLLAAQLERERREYDETVEAALRGFEDVKAGRTKPAEEVYQSLRLKYGV